MTISRTETDARVVAVEVTDLLLTAHLSDGRVISAPLDWYPRLVHGTPAERGRYTLTGGGYGIHWPDLDEDISIDNLLEGRRSAESARSFHRWLEARSGQTGRRGSSTA